MPGPKRPGPFCTEGAKMNFVDMLKSNLNILYEKYFKSEEILFFT